MPLAWVLWWMVVAEGFFSAIGWRGLTIFRWRLAPLLAFPLCALGAWLLITYTKPLSAGQHFAYALVGLALFTGLAIWRQRSYTTHMVLMPGVREGRCISRVDIPLTGGPMPALLVEPLEGSSTGVLVLHGAGVNKAFYSWPLLHRLVDDGMTACAIDIDGHGENPRVLDFPTVLENVEAGVAWLREHHRQVAVIGISQGGCIAARAVVEGVQVDALVLMEAPISVQVSRAVRWLETRTLLLPAVWELHRDIGTLGIVRGWYYTPTRSRIGTLDLIKRLDLLGSVTRITCPLLLCYAKNDAVVPVDQAYTLAERAAPGTQLLVISRATHLSLMVDRRAIRSVSSWLRQTLESSARLRVKE